MEEACMQSSKLRRLMTFLRSSEVYPLRFRTRNPLDQSSSRSKLKRNTYMKTIESLKSRNIFP